MSQAHDASLLQREQLLTAVNTALDGKDATLRALAEELTAKVALSRYMRVPVFCITTDTIIMTHRGQTVCS